MRIAVIADWLMVYSGAERVLEQILVCFPQADVFCLFDHMPEDQRGFLDGRRVFVSFLQNMPWIRKKYRTYMPLMPLAIEQLDVSSYDIVISSTHAVAKGVLVGPDQLHISYVYSPVRYAWDLQHQYLAEAKMTKGLSSWIARWLLHKMRIWDTRTSNSVDLFVADSSFVSRRIEKCYRRKSTVIYPPVNVDRFLLNPDKDKFYVTASRMVPYKKIPLIIEAFGMMPDRRLIVIGDGPEFGRCRAMAAPNVTLLGYQSAEVLIDHLQRARAFVFAAEEDFGIAPVEAQACGTPVIAFGKGGVTETVRGQPDAQDATGVFFYEQSANAIIDAVHRFERIQTSISPYDCRENALRFREEQFRTHFSAFVSSAWDAWQDRLAGNCGSYTMADDPRHEAVT